MLRRSLRAAPFALALAALVLAGPADAGGRKWKHHKRHHGHHGHHERNHHRHHHGCGHGGYYAPRYVEHHSYAYPVYHYGPPQAYCGPCGSHFDSYDHLSYHVHRHHHIAMLELPSVIFQASIGSGVGWVFDH